MSRLILRDANVVDGNGPAAPGRTVVVEKRRITAVTGDPVPVHDGDQVVDLGGKTVMPGMAQCHWHGTYSDIGTAPYGLENPPSYQAMVAYRNLQTALEYGYTTVVGAGAARDIEPGLKQAIQRRVIVGPRITPCGKELSTTGHANERYTAPWHWNLPELGAGRSCDGADEFRFAVRDEIRKGVEIIKLFATGGHGVPGSKHKMEMTRDELAAAIETAHSRDVLVRAHLAGKGPIMTAIELGIDIVDHCDDMDDEVIAALAETGTFVVPSVLYIDVTARSLENVDPSLAAGMKKDLAFVYDALPKAEAAGVRMLLGDDYGAPGLDHGMYGRELRLYVDEAGLPPLAVIGWATRNAAALLDRSDELGTVEVGKRADLLVIDGDPSIDIGVLADHKPLAVLIDGRVVAGSLETT